MFCNKCGKEIPDDSLFCPVCGVSVAKKENEEQENPQPERSQEEKPEQNLISEQTVHTTCDAPKKKRKKGIIVLAIILMVVVAIAIAGIVYLRSMSRMGSVEYDGFKFTAKYTKNKVELTCENNSANTYSSGWLNGSLVTLQTSNGNKYYSTLECKAFSPGTTETTTLSFNDVSGKPSTLTISDIYLLSSIIFPETVFEDNFKIRFGYTNTLTPQDTDGKSVNESCDDSITTATDESAKDSSESSVESLVESLPESTSIYAEQQEWAEEQWEKSKQWQEEQMEEAKKRQEEWLQENAF